MANAFRNGGHDQIIILDFGSQFSHLIARRVRELNVYCELHSCLSDVSVLQAAGDKLKGIILSGGPSSVYEEGAPHLSPAIWEYAEEKGLPILGICYGLQEMTHALGGSVQKAPHREYGHALVSKRTAAEEGLSEEAFDGVLFQGISDSFSVWMSHGDKLVTLAPGFHRIACSSNSEYAAVAGRSQAGKGKSRLFGIQFHPEVTHTPDGLQMLRNFCIGVAGCKQDWSMESFLEEAISSIQKTVGPHDHVIGAVSGGVDSTVAAVLLNKAIGSRFHAVMVDNGLLRKDERVQVLKRLKEGCGVNLIAVDASELFLSRLAGVEDPEKKRKIIGGAFVEVFEQEAMRIEKEVEEQAAAVAAAAEGGGAAAAGAAAAGSSSPSPSSPPAGKVRFLLQGTLYPDVIESVSFKGPSATIKSHHNVGGLLADMKLLLIEPLRELFKDEVRALGAKLSLPEDVLQRHPFPGPGLAIRILGAVTPEACALLREADAIYIEELRAAGEYSKISQAFSVLLPCKSVGVMGDSRTYEQVLALRAVCTTDFMTADWYPMPYPLLAKVSTRVINEVRGVNRVVYDVSSKPPATIEWE